MPLSQRTRIGELETPLGKDVLVLARVDATEGLSEMFEVRVEALSEQSGVNFDSIIGRNCSITFDNYGEERFLCGILVEAQAIGVREALWAYRLVLRPWIWLMGRKAKCKIFKDKNPKDIIKEVMRDYNSDIQDSAEGTYPKLEYCVQYRETDLAFVSRLMELYGIYYYFKHERGKHTLVLADSRSGHAAGAKLLFNPDVDLTHRDSEYLTHWTSERRFRSGKVTLRDYDYLNPTKNLEVAKEGSEAYFKSKLELYDYPRKYTERDQGEKFAKIRLEAEQALDHRRHGAGGALSLSPGKLFSLEWHPQAEENREYLVVRCAHTYVTEHYRSGASAISDQAYFGNYEVQPADCPFRALAVTPKAIVQGTHTGVVASDNAGEEIDVDEHGRILVHFFWERDTKMHSRRVRVAQLWAYKQWGFQYIPRVGMEVVVVYEEGDPDLPLVIGTVYNGDNKYPYTPKENKTQSGVKSNSSKGGNGYNEFMFEDLKHEEFIRMHAEKDHNVVVRNQETWKIGEIFNPPVGSPSRETTLENGDDKLEVKKGDQNVKIGMNQDVKVGLSITVEAGTKIELVCGASRITMTPASITINAPMVFIN